MCEISVVAGPDDIEADFRMCLGTLDNPGRAALTVRSLPPSPTPHTLQPTPYTLHLTPNTLHPTPYTLHPILYNLNPTSYTLSFGIPCPQESGFSLHEVDHECSGPRISAGDVIKFPPYPGVRV